MPDLFDRLVILFVIGFISLSACGDPYKAPLPPRDQINYPIGLEMHPDGRYLYVVNSNFRATFRPRLGGTVGVIDTHDQEVEGEYSPYLPSFGGDIQLNGNATKAYVSTRRGDAIAVYDVSPSGQRIFCAQSPANREADPADCLIDEIPGDDGQFSLPPDPFGLDVSTVQRTGEDGDAEFTDIVALSHIRGNRTSVITLPGQEFSAASFATAPIIEASNDVARRPGTMNFYAPARLSNRVGVFSPFVNESGEVESVLDNGRFSLSQRSGRTDGRAIAFSDNGRWAYIAARQPAAVHVVEIEDTGQTVSRRTIASIPTATGPSDLEIFRTSSGQRLLYVTCNRGKVIQVIDPEAGTIVDEVQLGARAYGIEIEQSGCGQGASSDCRAYVSLFNDPVPGETECEDAEDSVCGSIAIIDLDDQSDEYHEVIGKIR